MKFIFDKPACQNIRRALRKEWLLTNHSGDYASCTVTGCNTRKYHGLLVANLTEPPGRHVLLSTLEESVHGGEREFFFSSRKHPGVYYPKGHEYLERMEVGDWPVSVYRIGPLLIKREVLLHSERPLVIIRYTTDMPPDDEAMPQLSLRIKPLLAFRHMHNLTRANMDLQVTTFPLTHGEPGFCIRPYNALPCLYMQTAGAETKFYPSPDWCRNADYLVEEERGFPSQEDLFVPGVFELDIKPGATILLSASTEQLSEPLEALWQAEAERRAEHTDAPATQQEHLRHEGLRFLVHEPDASNQAASGQACACGETAPQSSHPEPSGFTGVVAGYHWFDVWGRDALIALPGLTFAAGRVAEGQAVLAAISKTARHGLIPNMFAQGNSPAAYNSVDTSLWYVWAVQQMLAWAPDREPFIREVCWPVLKAMLDSYRNGPPPGSRSEDGPPIWPPVWTDEEGMLHAGNAETQLTWMDATVSGKPVTPRYGCPVEISALWYNAVAFADDLAHRYGEPEYRNPDLWRMRTVFRHRFWTPEKGGHLGDVWQGGKLDPSIRPNQIFAVAVPYSPLDPDDQPFVVENVRNNLLTPYGLRTLSPCNPAYEGRYEGGPDSRDAAYHQGTVWPWLLGAYGEAMLKTAWDVDGAVRALLTTLTPLFRDHLADAGLGSISEIFDGNPPHTPGGCIAQAWSVAECYRLLRLLERAAPEIYATWELQLTRR